MSVESQFLASPHPSPAAQNPLASTGCREMMEVQSHAQQLLAAIFEITITEEASVSILDSYPELVWLANCLRRCPLPLRRGLACIHV